MTDSKTQTPLTAQHAIVLVVDRLAAPFLGPYGNTWLDTPQFNRLAASSMLMEHALIESTEPLGPMTATFSLPETWNSGIFRLNSPRR